MRLAALRSRRGVAPFDRLKDSGEESTLRFRGLRTIKDYTTVLSDLSNDVQPYDVPWLVLACVVLELHPNVVVIGLGDKHGELPTTRALTGADSSEEYFLRERAALDLNLESLRRSEVVHRTEGSRRFIVVPIYSEDSPLPSGQIFCEFDGMHDLESVGLWLKGLGRVLSGAASKSVAPLMKSTTERWHELRRVGLQAFKKQRFEHAEVSLRAGFEVLGNDPNNFLQRARTLNDLATLKAALGDYIRAEELFYEALSGFEDSSLLGSSDRSACLNNLGSLYMRLNQPEQAETQFLQGLEILESQDDEHPKLIPVLCNLATLYDKRGLSDMTKILFERAVGIATRRLNPDHPDFKRCLDRFRQFNERA